MIRWTRGMRWLVAGAASLLLPGQAFAQDTTKSLSLDDAVRLALVPRPERGDPTCSGSVNVI